MRKINQRIASAWSKHIVQASVRGYQREARTEHQAQRIASSWLRIAVSPRFVSIVQEKMRNEDLPFEHIFGDRKRIAIPAPELSRPLEATTKTYMRVPLKHFGLMDDDAEIDWLQGQVKQEGKSIRLGKMIAKAQQKFAKENPKMWAVIKAKIKAGRDLAKSTTNLKDYVLEPLQAILNTAFGESGNHQDHLTQLQVLIQGSYENSRAGVPAFDNFSNLDPEGIGQVKDMLLTVLGVSDEQLADLNSSPQKMLEEAERWEQRAAEARKAYDDNRAKAFQESLRLQQEQKRLLSEADSIREKARDRVKELEEAEGKSFFDLSESEDERIKAEIKDIGRAYGKAKKIKEKAEALTPEISEAIHKAQSAPDPEAPKIWGEYEEAKKKANRLRRWAESGSEALALYASMPETQRKDLVRSVERAYDDLIRDVKNINTVNQQYDVTLESTLDRTESQSDRDDLQYDIQNMYALEAARIKYDLWKETAQDNHYLVVSRAPVDVLRMSDHPTAPQKIQSCHSEGGSYFHCAVTEAQGSGFVGYIVSKKDLDKVDLEADEIFADVHRGVEGIVPLSRIRFRRFERNTDPPNPALDEIALPEARTYGGHFEGFTDFAREWARKVQPELFKEKPAMREYSLTGGEYRDNPDGLLFNLFFGERREPESGNTSHKEKRSKKRKPPPVDERGRLLMDWEEGADWDAPARVDPQLEAFWRWVEEHHPQIKNPNPDGRQDRITPATLRSYADGDGPHATRAQSVVRSLMDTYYNLVRQQRGQQGGN
jgi:hypothetical protein